MLLVIREAQRAAMSEASAEVYVKRILEFLGIEGTRQNKGRAREAIKHAQSLRIADSLVFAAFIRLSLERGLDFACDPEIAQALERDPVRTILTLAQYAGPL